jgi:hypothetical protein
MFRTKLRQEVEEADRLAQQVRLDLGERWDLRL